MQIDRGSIRIPCPFPGGSRYNSHAASLKKMFGCRVYKVSVDAGFTCPNRDGSVATGGCTYCDNDSFRPPSASRSEPIPGQVQKGIGYLRERYGAGKFIVYFQPFSNTHAPLNALVPLYESALAHPDVIGLSVGTRPDCVDETKIWWFEELSRRYFVILEYGLESIYDTTLNRINRGHTFQCWQEAVSQTRNRGIWISAHLILGFPWENRNEMLAMAGVVSTAGLDLLKIHHLHVLKHTALAREYQENPFHLLGYQEYLGLLVDFLERLNPDIK
jgi:radical SAM protein (TIGR01212 family)